MSRATPDRGFNPKAARRGREIRPRVVYLGGVAGVGKTFTADRWTVKLPSVRTVALSELMLQHLPGVPDRRDILSSTTPDQRSRARRRAIMELRLERDPVLLTRRNFSHATRFND